MAAKQYNVGVIGYGMSAKVFHIPLILRTPSFNLAAIVQRSPTPDNDASKDHPSAQLYNSTDSLFADSSIDIIIVTTPPSTHYALATSALQAGKHVLVEKPFVPTSALAASLHDLSRSTGKALCIYQNRRWDSDFLTVKKLVEDGTIGRVVEFNTHFDRYKPVKPTTWKGELSMAEGGGVVYDLGSHLIDQAFVLFGLPSSVFASFANQRGDGGEGVEPDSITILLRYGVNGPLVTVKASVMSIEAAQPRFWVRGTTGSYKKSHLDPQEDQLKAGALPGDSGFGLEPSEKAGVLSVLDERTGKVEERRLENVAPETYLKLYEGFARAVESGNVEDVPVKATEARDVLRVIEAAKESAKTGRVVELA